MNQLARQFQQIMRTKTELETATLEQVPVLWDRLIRQVTSFEKTLRRVAHSGFSKTEEYRKITEFFTPLKESLAKIDEKMQAARQLGGCKHD